MAAGYTGIDTTNFFAQVVHNVPQKRILTVAENSYGVRGSLEKGPDAASSRNAFVNEVHPSGSPVLSNGKVDLLQQMLAEIDRRTGIKAKMMISPVIVRWSGSHKRAIFFCQLLYWTGRSTDGGWVYKSWKDWEAETALTQSDVKRAGTYFKAEGLIETELKKVSGAPTLHYRIKIPELRNSMGRFLQIGLVKMTKSIRSKQPNPFGQNDQNLLYIDYTQEPTHKDIPPKPPKGGGVGEQAKHPKQKLRNDDPMILAIAEVCHIDPKLNSRSVQRLAKDLRAAGYYSNAVHDFGATWSEWWNPTIKILRERIADEADDDQDTKGHTMACVSLVDGSVEERRWENPKHTATCHTCKTSLFEVFTVYGWTDKSGGFVAFCSDACARKFVDASKKPRKGPQS